MKKADVLRILDELRITGRAPIGPLYGAGWNGALEAVRDQVKAQPDDNGEH